VTTRTRAGAGIAFKRRSMRSRAFLTLVLAFWMAASGAAARADRIDDLVAAAAPEVRDAIQAEPLAARGALTSLLDRGVIPREHISAALGLAVFAPYVVSTLRALAKVDGIEGAGVTFERLTRQGDDGGVRGAAFEIEVAAALGDRVAAIGPVVDGNEVDLLLVDGTRVEVKNDAPDGENTLSNSLSSKAIKQLKKRGSFGNPVLLVSNEPLAPETLTSFRKRLGPTSEVMVLSGGRTWTQLARGHEGRVQRVKRLAIGKLRRTLFRGKTRVASALEPAGKALRKLQPRRLIKKIRWQNRTARAAAK
jgi:hypothetical protein